MLVLFFKEIIAPNFDINSAYKYFVIDLFIFFFIYRDTHHILR